MKEITLPVNETKGTDLRTSPINVTDEEGNEIGSIFIGIGSGKIFISKYNDKTFTITPSDLWDALFPD